MQDEIEVLDDHLLQEEEELHFDQVEKEQEEMIWKKMMTKFGWNDWKLEKMKGSNC